MSVGRASFDVLVLALSAREGHAALECGAPD